MQSNLVSEGIHLAIVMDGNGRWATRRGLPRTAGHKAGLEALRRTVDAAPAAGVAILTVFAFSSDNWRRPAEEVGLLIGLMRAYLARDCRRLAAAGVRLEVIGRRDRLPPGLREAVESAERMTVRGSALLLRVAFDYSSRDAILTAARALAGDVTRDTFAEALGHGGAGSAPDVDLLVRTGGEKRLSDFLLWECAYAEMHFTDIMWPDFDAASLADAMADFRRRDRRFGALPAVSAAVGAAA